MNSSTQTQEFANNLSYGQLQNLHSLSFPTGSEPSSLHYVLLLPKLTLTISKVKVHHTGLDLVVSLGFSNAEHLIIPPPYIQILLHKLNSTSANFSYDQCDEPNSLMLTCALSVDTRMDFSKILDKCCALLQQDAKILEKSLELIGIFRAKGKNSLKMKKAQLSLKKKVVDQIKANKGCANSHYQPSSNPLIFQTKKITELQPQTALEEKTKKGGYFQVRRVQCKVMDAEGNVTIKDLACKTPRNNKKVELSTAPKLKKQISIAYMLHDPTHFVKYFVEDSKETTAESLKQKLYMEFIPDLLKHKLYKSNISAMDLIELSKQLIHAVGVMHQSGVVHRDLKPENILIEEKEGKLGLKIIDFGQSALTSSEFDKKFGLGCTLPYSPIQCLTRTEAGFNKPEIDLWSLCMILYQMVFQSLPMFYSRFIGPQIVESWKTKKEFSIFPLYRKRRGYRAVEEIISMVSICGLQCQQQERLKIGSLKKIFQAIEEYTRAV